MGITVISYRNKDEKEKKNNNCTQSKVPNRLLTHITGQKYDVMGRNRGQPTSLWKMEKKILGKWRPFRLSHPRKCTLLLWSNEIIIFLIM